jgi:hypothetical protein
VSVSVTSTPQPPTAATVSLITVDSGMTLTLRNITFKGIDNNTAPLIKVLTGGGNAPKPA